MSFLRPIIILILLCICTSPGYAQDIHIVTDTWEGYSSKDGTGYYLDILNEIYPYPQYTLTVSNVPFKRALRMVETDLADITIGVNIGDIDADLIAKPVVENDSVDLLISKESARKWQGLHSLKNKRIAARRGYGFDIHFDFPIDYSENNTLAGMMRMLKVGRLDAVLDYSADIRKLWRQSGLDDNYTIIEAVLVNQAFFAFSRNQQNLKAHFEKKFPELLQSGRIHKLGKRYGLDESQLP